MNRIIGASACTALIQIVGTALFLERMPITYYLIGALLQFGFIVLIRFSYRILLVEKKKLSSRGDQMIPTLILGAGENGRRAIRHFEDHTVFRPVAVLDSAGAGKSLDGIPVEDGEPADLAKKYHVQAVCIADTKLDPDQKKQIREFCDAQGLELQDFTGRFSNLGGRLPLTALMELARGPVTLITEDGEKRYESGDEALRAVSGRYDVAALNDLKVELRKPSAQNSYDRWMENYKAETGEDISFF